MKMTQVKCLRNDKLSENENDYQGFKTTFN